MCYFAREYSVVFVYAACSYISNDIRRIVMIQASADEASSEDTDDVDAALNELQSSLEGQNNDQKSKNLAQYPELKDYHMFLKYASII
jgi:hypothetical protein